MIALLLKGGVLAVAVASLLGPRAWGTFNPLFLPVALGVTFIQFRIAGADGDGRRARRTAYALDCALVAVFAACVGDWGVGACVILLGYACNHAAVLSNGLAMPAVRRHRSILHRTVGRRTRMRWLCDILPSPVPGGTLWYSIGDALTAIGAWALAADMAVAGLA